MVFKTLETGLSNFINKSWDATLKDLKNKTFQNPFDAFFKTYKSGDNDALMNYIADLDKGITRTQAFKNNLSTASATVKQQALEIAKLNTQYKTGAIDEQTYRSQLSAITSQTETLTIKQKTLAAVTKLVSSAFQLVKAAVVTIAFNLIITAITQIVNKQKELAEQTKQTADEAKQSYLQSSSFTNPLPPHNIKKRKIAGAAVLRSSAEYITERRGKMNENDKCSTDGLTIPQGRFPQDTPLAMAYVPYQEWEDTYAENVALAKGTIFPSLDMPFLGKEGVAQYGK